MLTGWVFLPTHCSSCRWYLDGNYVCCRDDAFKNDARSSRSSSSGLRPTFLQYFSIDGLSIQFLLQDLPWHN